MLFFSFFIGIATEASNQEVLAATAAYMAVCVCGDLIIVEV